MKTATIIVNILLLIILIPAILMAFTSPMIFDAGESKQLWWIFGVALALPILIIVCQISSWIVFYRQNYNLAFKISIIPIANALLLISLLFTMGFTSENVNEKQKTVENALIRK